MSFTICDYDFRIERIIVTNLKDTLTIRPLG